MKNGFDPFWSVDEKCKEVDVWGGFLRHVCSLGCLFLLWNFENFESCGGFSGCCARAPRLNCIHYMNKIQHISNNAVLGAPQDWDQGEMPCNALPITRRHVGDLPVVLSYWRPDAGELAALNAGGAVRLWVVGATMPPVMLDVESSP